MRETQEIALRPHHPGLRGVPCCENGKVKNPVNVGFLGTLAVMPRPQVIANGLDKSRGHGTLLVLCFYTVLADSTVCARIGVKLMPLAGWLAQLKKGIR